MTASASWRLQRAWQVGPAQWLVWWGAVVLSAAALSIAAVDLRGTHRQKAELAGTPLPLPVAAAQPVPVIGAKDFALGLGEGPPIAAVLQELQRACARADVALASEQIRSRSPSPELLGRLELVVTLRGTYAGSKQVLKQVIDRFPTMTLQRLAVRRGASLADVEATATLSVWSAPLNHGAGGAPSRP